MDIRYARDNDLEFLIAGLQDNRAIERRREDERAASTTDIGELRQAIREGTIRVLEDEGEPVAFLYFRTDFDVLYIRGPFFWIDLVYVRKDYRRRGLGRRLYEDALTIARERGFERVVVDVFEANEGSRRFHRQLGFEPVYTIYQRPVRP
ncbi:MAG TPA: GNAT family N-acetyltransferase [Phycisphaerales bacterium]|nr:GNAT family N-acetyltransferase [Phycisphaerales bacterium]